MLRQRWLVRGESVIAPIGVSLAAIILAVIVALAWWNLRTHRDFNKAARIDQVKATSDLLAQSAEALLAADKLTSARRLLIEAARIYDLTGCRIVLPDGRVVADADPLRITAHKLPDRGHWPVAPHAGWKFSVRAPVDGLYATTRSSLASPGGPPAVAPGTGPPASAASSGGTEPAIGRNTAVTSHDRRCQRTPLLHPGLEHRRCETRRVTPPDDLVILDHGHRRDAANTEVAAELAVLLGHGELDSVLVDEALHRRLAGTTGELA